MAIGGGDASRRSAQADGQPWPSVSVIMPTHLRPELLRSAMRSVLSQRYPGAIECLVVFDQEDPTPVDDLSAPGRIVRALSNDRTPGPAGAYNVGLLAAVGDYVAWCDDDDEWLPGKLALQVGLMQRHPEMVCSITGIRLAVADGSGRGPIRIPGRGCLTVDDLFRSPRNTVHSSTFMVRRDRLEEIGLVDEGIPGSYGEDFDWLLRGAHLGPVGAIRRPLARIRLGDSHFADRWPLIAEAISYHLEHCRDLEGRPRARARLYGRLGFAHAAMGDRPSARRWAREALALHWREPRALVTWLVVSRLISPARAVRLAHAVGRGV